MKIQNFALIFYFLFICNICNAQDKIDVLLKEGIQYHDQGEFEKAIQSYKKALKLEPNSTLINYEIAMSSFSMGDYESAIKYSDAVLARKSEHMILAYVTKGSSLDVLGKTKESIKLLQKAIKKEGAHYLLCYNLALNYFKMGELDSSETYAIKAIQDKSSHPTSHLLLATLHDKQGNSVKTLLAAHYFLFLEPNTGRSQEAYKMIRNLFTKNVSENEDGSINLIVPSMGNQVDNFSTGELSISMIQASNSLEENKDKTDNELFFENTESIFKILGELDDKSEESIWWTFYVDFFYTLAESKHLRTYCNYISQSSDPLAIEWLEENRAQLIEFDNWVNKN